MHSLFRLFRMRPTMLFLSWQICEDRRPQNGHNISPWSIDIQAVPQPSEKLKHIWPALQDLVTRGFSFLLAFLIAWRFPSILFFLMLISVMPYSDSVFRSNSKVRLWVRALNCAWGHLSFNDFDQTFLFISILFIIELVEHFVYQRIRIDKGFQLLLSLRFFIIVSETGSPSSSTFLMVHFQPGNVIFSLWEMISAIGILRSMKMMFSLFFTFFRYLDKLWVNSRILTAVKVTFLSRFDVQTSSIAM